MKLPTPSRRVRLVLSILFLLFSLVFYWWAVGSPMPTPGLAHRAALLSHGLTPGPVEAQGEIHFQEITRSPDSRLRISPRSRPMSCPQLTSSPSLQ